MQGAWKQFFIVYTAKYQMNLVYLFSASNMLSDVLDSDRILVGQLETLALHSRHIHQHTSVCIQTFNKKTRYLGEEPDWSEQFRD